VPDFQTNRVAVMSTKHVPPSLGVRSFSCPRCGALAHQTWFKLWADSYDKDEGPTAIDAAFLMQAKSVPKLHADVLQQYEKMAAGLPILQNTGEHRAYTNLLVQNAFVSRCFSCRDLSIWVANRIVDPVVIQDGVEPNEDMPPDVLVDYREAQSLVGISPRGAAALLRLAIQELMPHLGLPGKNLNDDIGLLVSNGLDTRVQQALDVVRVIGNNAVHPGQIDLRDDAGTASRLFHLVNIIVESTISAQKHVKEMFEGLPETAKQQIALRDKKGAADENTT
jgi:hypothetical protein